MPIIFINGSPRKNGNTATMLSHALEGARAQGATTELINLYDLTFKGCISCFLCKLKGGKSYGQCGFKDGLSPLLEKIEKADAVFLGSPIYFGNVTGEMRSLIERMLFPYLVYDQQRSSLLGKKLPVGLIYTMNIPEKHIPSVGYEAMFQALERPFRLVYGYAETVIATDTYQFDDYAKYESSAFFETEKATRRRDIFPLECQKAYELGSRFAADKLVL